MYGATVVAIECIGAIVNIVCRLQVVLMLLTESWLIPDPWQCYASHNNAHYTAAHTRLLRTFGAVPADLVVVSVPHNQIFHNNIRKDPYRQSRQFRANQHRHDGRHHPAPS